MKVSKLVELYQRTSKHSNYQVLPERVIRLLPGDLISVQSRSEKERLDYICSKLDFSGLTLADIGGNTGFFSIEVLNKGAEKVFYYEGNKDHCEFVSCVKKLLDIDSNLEVNNIYIDFQDIKLPAVDCVFLLNVLHHVGDDYGNRNLDRCEVKESILIALKNLSLKTKFLVLQVGFNWKGNCDLPIFENGTKSEVISLINQAEKYFEVFAIGVAVNKGFGVFYEDLNDKNIQRNDSIGEFLNRPIFILRSKRFL